MTTDAIFTRDFRGQKGGATLLWAKDKNGDPIALVGDQFGGLCALTPDHFWTHLGWSFDASYILGKGSELADLTSFYFLFTLGASTHFVCSATVGGTCEFYIYRNPTGVSGGTPITIFNKNEYIEAQSPTQPTSNTLTHTPTFASPHSLGTTRASAIIPGGVKTAGSGGTDTSFAREINGMSGSTYLFEIKNISGAIQVIDFDLEFYHPQTL